MKKYLMKIKVNMLIVLIISLLGGMAGSYFFNNRWLGLIVAIPLCALYIRCRQTTANSTPKRNTLISTDKLRLETQNCPEAAYDIYRGCLRAVAYFITIFPALPAAYP